MAEATSTSSSRDQARIRLGSYWDQVWDEGRDQFNLAICVSVQIALIMRKTEMAIAGEECARKRERESNTNNDKRCNKTEIGARERGWEGERERAGEWMNEAGREVNTKWLPFNRAIPVDQKIPNCPDSCLCLWLLCKQSQNHTLPARGYLSLFSLFELQY